MWSLTSFTISFMWQVKTQNCSSHQTFFLRIKIIQVSHFFFKQQKSVPVTVNETLINVGFLYELDKSVINERNAGLFRPRYLPSVNIHQETDASNGFYCFERLIGSLQTSSWFATAAVTPLKWLLKNRKISNPLKRLKKRRKKKTYDHFHSLHLLWCLACVTCVWGNLLQETVPAAAPRRENRSDFPTY